MRNILDTLITDRTQDDVAAALALCAKGWGNMSEAERARYSAGLKGAYSFIDLNRVIEALEYLDGLMAAAGEEGGYEPATISHKVPLEFDGDGTVTRWKEWTDSRWMEYDFLRPVQWAAHLDSIRRLWAKTRRLSARVLPVYDPWGGGSIKPGESFTALDVCGIDECIGLLELRAAVNCPPGSVEISGEGWTVDGSSAALLYPGGRWMDLDDALGALEFRCVVPDGITDAEISFFATLRHDAERPLGTCAVRWSPFILWGEARNKYGAWGETKPLTWGQAARGGADDDR